MKDAILGITLAAHVLWLSGDDRGVKADLRGADLRGAKLRGADRLIGPQRSDGYQFTYCTADKIVYAGCRRMSIADYREHTESYDDEEKRKETLAILAFFESMENAS